MNSIKVDEIINSSDLSMEEEKSSMLTISCEGFTVVDDNDKCKVHVPLQQVAFVAQVYLIMVRVSMLFILM